MREKEEREKQLSGAGIRAERERREAEERARERAKYENELKEKEAFEQRADNVRADRERREAEERVRERANYEKEMREKEASERNNSGLSVREERLRREAEERAREAEAIRQREEFEANESRRAQDLVNNRPKTPDFDEAPVMTKRTSTTAAPIFNRPTRGDGSNIPAVFNSTQETSTAAPARTSVSGYNRLSPTAPPSFSRPNESNTPSFARSNVSPAPPPLARPSHPDNGITARALYDYSAAESNEIDLVEGQLVIRIEKIDEGWWKGVGPDGKEGLFPADYVEVIEDGLKNNSDQRYREEEQIRLEEQRQSEQRRQQEEERQKAEKRLRDERAREETAKREQEQRAEQERRERELQQSRPVMSKSSLLARALYDYEAQESNEINLTEGETISDVVQVDEGWWTGLRLF